MEPSDYEKLLDPPGQTPSRKRPVGITLTALLLGYYCLVTLTGSVLLFTSPDLEELRSLSIVIGLLLIVFAILDGISSVGLLYGKPWAPKWAARALLGLIVLKIGTTALAGEGWLGQIIESFIALMIITYLLSHDDRKFFEPDEETESKTSDVPEGETGPHIDESPW